MCWGTYDLFYQQDFNYLCFIKTRGLWIILCYMNLYNSEEFCWIKLIDKYNVTDRMFISADSFIASTSSGSKNTK